MQRAGADGKTASSASTPTARTRAPRPLAARGLRGAHHRCANVQEFISREEVSASAQLNARGWCSEHCTFYIRWRPTDTSAWTNGPSREVGSITDTAWHETVTGLGVNTRYGTGAAASSSSAVAGGEVYFTDQSPGMATVHAYGLP